MKKFRIAIASICFALLMGGLSIPANAQDENPYLQPDETWISISGTAINAQDQSFTLDYGDGTVTVEMDDWDWYDENAEMLEGNKVTVYGEIDDDLYETTSIEASSVYNEDLGTYFYANSADEEYTDDYDFWMDYDPIVVGQSVIRGIVTSVDDREFTIDRGVRELQVDTGEMAYNPMDNLGYQIVDVGDYVSVSGEMDNDFWEERELVANTVVTLYDD